MLVDVTFAFLDGFRNFEKLDIFKFCWKCNDVDVIDGTVSTVVCVEAQSAGRTKNHNYFDIGHQRICNRCCAFTLYC